MKTMIIGGGNMGMTFAKAFVNSHVMKPEQLMILEKDKKDRIERLKSYEIGQILTDTSKVSEADLVILSVKPQDAKKLFSQIKSYVDNSQVIISIMAGITIEVIKKSLNVTKVIRAMPNLPSQIGIGMTAFTSTEEVSRFEEQYVQLLLQQTGKAINVDTEEQIDAVTAISGSGPAYVYYFMDSMITAAVDLGIDPIKARLLVLQTFSGSINLFQVNSLSCKEWINKVASKGGTTEAAIKLYEYKNLNEIIIEGTKEAFKRAVELGK